MKLEYFIATRLISQRNLKGRKTEPAVRIAIIGIAVGLAVMIVAWSVVLGFRQEVRNKVIGVNAHIQLTSYYSNFTYEMDPVTISDALLQGIQQVKGVSHIQRMYTKPGMIKTENDFQTIILKGIDSTYDQTFIRDALIEGTMPDIRSATNQVLISELLADKLHLKVGDAFPTYFLKDKNVSPRKFTICGIYNTHFSAFDKYFLIGDARHVRKLNNWSDQQAAGLEIFVHSMQAFPQTEAEVYAAVSAVSENAGETYYMRNLFEINPELFGWLDLLDTNVWLILILMIFVSGFNIISGLLILILERINMIGILKAMGTKNASLRKIFMFLSAYLIGKGLLWGNIIGLTICLIQDLFGLIPLNANTYYVDSVPIDINWLIVIFLNIGTVLVSLLVVFMPTHMISKIRPVKAIKFE